MLSCLLFCVRTSVWTKLHLHLVMLLARRWFCNTAVHKARQQVLQRCCARLVLLIEKLVHSSGARSKKQVL